MQSDLMQSSWQILDLRGLILHCYHSGTDPDSTVDSEGNVLPSPGFTVCGFLDRYLWPLISEYPLNHIIAVKDAGSHYRKTIFPDYKAHKKPLPPTVTQAMSDSIRAVDELLKSLGIPIVSCPGTEADDVIAHLCRGLPGRIDVHTVDGDLVALASERVSVYQKGSLTTTFKGVLPRHTTLYKSLVGDTSDNIPGVPGFGHKSWEKLVEQYGLDGLDELDSLEYRDLLVEEAGQHPLLSKLHDNFAAWRRCYDLARLHPELIDCRQGKRFARLQWEKRIPSAERLRKLLADIGCEYLFAEFEIFLPKQFLIQKDDFDDAALEEAQQLFAESRFISLDYETHADRNENFIKAGGPDYVDIFGSEVVGMGITCGRNLQFTFYFNFGHADIENRIPKEKIRQLIGVIPPKTPIVIQNLSFEQTVTGVDLGFRLPVVYDTKVMASHIDEAESSGLKDLSKRWLNYDQTRYRDVVKPGETMRDKTSQEVFQYGADDPLCTAHIFDLFYIILNLEGTWEFVRDNEFPFVEELVDSFIAGVSLDWNEVERQTQEDQTIRQECLDAIRGTLRENQTEESIADGIANWQPELEANYDAVTKQGVRTIQKNPLDIESYPKIWSLVKDSVPEEYAEVYLNSCQNRKAKFLEEQLSKIRYQDFRIEAKPAAFQFRTSTINAIAKGFDLPELPTCGKLSPAVVRQYIDSLELPLSQDQREFLVKLREVAGQEKDRTKLPSYSWLAQKYTAPGKEKKIGTELNLNSPVQMQTLLYGTLGLPIRLRTLDVSIEREQLGLPGSVQTNEDALRTAIAMGDVPKGSWKRVVVDALMKARKADTRLKFFYTKLPLWKHPKDGLIHPQFDSTGTETRRPSGSSPNLLQLGKKEEGVKVRRCFIPNQKLGHDLVVSIDWSAQELRALAGLSKDPALLSCYVGDNKRDVHSVTAAAIQGTSYDQFVTIRRDEEHPRHKVYDDVRKLAKNVNFGATYGIGPDKLARMLLCPPYQAKDSLDAKKRAYPVVEVWRTDEKQNLHALGFAKTLFGSRKHVFDKLFTEDEGLLGYYERATINYLIQGLCADYLKKVVSDIRRQGIFQKHGAVLIAPIYDELVMSCHSSQAVGLIMNVYRVMTQGIPGIDVPMLAMPSLGVNFGDQVEILKDEDDELTEEKIQVAIDKVLKRVKNEAA